MHRLKNIRKQLGLTQLLMAGYLGIGRTMLNMVEKGKRDLNSTAMLKLADMEKSIYRLELDKQKGQKELPVKLPAGVNPEIEEDIHLNTLILNKKIRKIETGFQQARNLEKVLRLLGEERFEKSLLSCLKLKITADLNRYSSEARKVLRNKFLTLSNQFQTVKNHLQGAMYDVAL